MTPTRDRTDYGSCGQNGLATKVAEQLLARINELGEAVLPTVVALCAHYRVSKPTMLSALHILRDRGVVDYRRGQRILVAGRSSPHKQAQRTTAQQQLANKIESSIGSAAYRSRQVLPKIRFLASTHGVSDRTVVGALRLLAEQGRIHKRGRSWVVGPAPQTNVNAFVRGPSTIILLQARQLSWVRVASSERTSHFSQSFTAESQSHGVQIIPVLIDENATPRGTVVAGRHGIEQLVRKLGDRYLGTLMVSQEPGFNEFKGFTELLLGYRRPVVWFDAFDVASPPRFDSRFFTRCHFYEAGAMKLALEFLAGMGHRTIGYLNNNDHGKGEWSHRRGALLAQASGAVDPPVHISTRAPLVAWWNEMSESALADLLKRQHAFGIPNVKSAIDRLLHVHPLPTSGGDQLGPYRGLAMALRDDQVRGRALAQYFQILTYAPVVVQYLRDPAITALITPRDYDAGIYYFWLRSAGLELPRDYSLLSFDNYLQLDLYPVTTIDFGFGYLGYAAFHSILGDIPIRRDRYGDVAAQPTVVRRGSVGAPRMGPLQAHLRDSHEWL